MPRPEPFEIDHGLDFIQADACDDGPHLHFGSDGINLGPGEARELRDWLSKAIAWAEGSEGA